MFLSPYFQLSENTLTVSPEQASKFAKSVADDFNPIHDADAKRFCVPGDLLFSLILSHYGLHQSMSFTFKGMVGKGVELHFPDTISDTFTLQDLKDKPYLSVEKSGGVSHDKTQIEQFIRAYVAFSGHNFVDILVPLMRKHGVMINPSRPLVIYENMSVDLSSFDFKETRLSLDNAELSVDGKRGDASLKFSLYNERDELIGQGHKSLILSGLRVLDEDAITAMLAEYNQRKQSL
ncbi:MAG: DUF3581 domain-containing protein [Sinobacterium sp.]|nr:DUF3581 domain-containing protein [Sinobacterium sp.]